MPNYARIQSLIDRGLGHAGRKLGQPFTAFRVGDTSTGDFPSQWVTVETDVPLFRRRRNERLIESALEYAGTIWYDIVGDVADFLLSDVFVCTDPPYVPGISYGAGATLVEGSTFEFNGFALAWHFPVHKPIGARIDRRCQVYRPLLDPDPMIDGTPAWRQSNDRSMPMVLAAGAFSFQPQPATASFVPCGMSSTARPGRGDNFPPSVAGMTPVTRYYCYLPFLPGYEPVEGDRIITEDGARYVVMNPYKQEAGVVGSQLVLERMISQTV